MCFILNSLEKLIDINLCKRQHFNLIFFSSNQLFCRFVYGHVMFGMEFAFKYVFRSDNYIAFLALDAIFVLIFFLFFVKTILSLLAS